MFRAAINILNSDYFSKNWTSRTCQNCFSGEGAGRGEMLSEWIEVVRASHPQSFGKETERRGMQ
jgi:hypothetical protein